MESSEADRFVALFEYHTQEKGRSEDEAREPFKGIAADS